MNLRAGALLMTLLVLAVAPGCSKKEDVLTGEVDATEVDVGVKIAGRLSRVAVHEGDLVKKDQLLGNLQSREMEAKLQAAQAAQQEAKEQLDLADKSFARVANLYRTGVVPKQQFDETKYKYAAARQKIEATTGQLNEVKAYYDEMLLKAPIDGEVVQIVAHAGEIVSPGYPVVTILDLSDQWVTFNAREDRLKNIHKGTVLHVTFPALGEDTYTFTVNYISALGTFAKWKATNEQGSFDLKTFEVRARSGERIEALRPGMTALITAKK
jgi:HlyD family secretion protein